MSKGQKSNKENKKKPLITAKEKKVAKRNKKASKDGISLFENNEQGSIFNGPGKRGAGSSKAL